MNAKERVQQSLNHTTTDKIAIDFGSTPVTGIHVLAIEQLRKHYGLEQKPVKVTEPFQMLGEVDDDLMEVIGVDVIGISPKNNMFGFANENWKEYKTQWGQTVLVPGEFNVKPADDGGTLMFPGGDTSLTPCAKMPEDSYFFDAIIRQKPIEEDKLDPADNMEEFAHVTDADLEYWKKEVEKAEKKGKGIIANFGGTAVGDIALVPGMNLKNPKGIRDVAEWYMSVVMRPDYVKAVFDKQTDIAVENFKKIYQVVGNKIDAVFICGTDFGTQDSQFCSPETFNEMYAPYYRKMNDWIHQNTTWKTFKHSCGAVEPFMKLFIESGFDIINPVQISAANMDPGKLKDNYGNHLVFWGGGVDTQNVLAYESPEKVREQVLKQCEILGKNGGFIFNTVHNIQANVPIENNVAMVEALKEV